MAFNTFAMNEHNHDASETPRAHPSLRGLNVEQRTEVAAMSQAGVAPRTIAAAMRNSGSGSFL